MAEPLRWLFEVQNRISGPAKAAGRDLAKLRGRLGETQKALDNLNRARGPVGGGLDRSSLPRSLDMSSSALRQIQGRTQGVAANMGFIRANALLVVGAVLAVGRGLQEVAALVARIARGTAELVAHFTEAVVQAGMLRSRALFGLERILGSPSQAREALGAARDLSEFLGTDLHETVSSLQTLMAQGFGAGEARTFFQAMADMKAVNPAANIEGMTLAISQIRSAGMLRGQELNQLVNAGVNRGALMESIGRRLNLTGDREDVSRRVAALMAQGQISSDVTMQGILDTIQNATGREIGGATREFSTTLPGLFMRLQQAPARFFDAIAESSEGAFGTLREMLSDVVSLLDPASAGFRRVVQIASTGFSVIVDVMRTAWMVGRALFEGLFGAIGPSETNRAADALRSVREALAWLREPATLAKVRAFGAGLVALWRATAPLRTALLLVAAGVAVIVATITLSLATIAAAAVAIPVAIVGAVAGVIVFVEELVPRAVQWGIDIVQGLIDGLTSMLEPLRAAGSSVANAVTGGLDAVLSFGSPSRTMRQLGEMTGAGFALGLDSSMPTVGLGLPGPGELASGGSGGPINFAPNMHIEVHGAGSPEETADVLRQILPTELQAAFELLAAEYGMA